MKAKVYFNLHRKCWSVLTKVGDRWKVSAYCQYLVMQDVRFVVSEAGRQRVIREGRKNVHAFAYGTLVKSAPVPCVWKIRYNPYTAPTFVDGNDRPVHQADYAVFEGRNVYISVKPDYTQDYCWRKRA